MSSIFLLVKNYYLNFFNRVFKNSKNKKATSLVIPVIVLGVISSVGFFSLLSYTTINALKDSNYELAIYSFSTTALMFSLMLIATEGSVGMKSTDEEMLLSLPIKKYDIIISKILYYIIFDLVIIMMLLLPSYIIYGIVVESAKISLVIRGIIMIVGVALFSNGCSGIVNTCFNRLTKKFKHSSVIQSLLSLLLVVVFVFIYISFTLLSQNPESMVRFYQIYPIRLLSEFVLKGEVVDSIVLAILVLIPFMISIVLKTKLFGKNFNTYHSDNKELNYSEGKIENTLLKKEINKYFSIPIYVSNTALGFLMGIGLAIVLSIMGKDNFISMIKVVIASGYENDSIPSSIETMINGYFDYILIMIFVLILTIMPITACSISIEGKEIWILKAHPISEKDIFKSKIKVHLAVCIIPVIIVSILLSTLLEIKFLPIIFVLLTLASLLCAMNGLYSNLLFPKLEWESEMEAVKQGISVLVAMILNFVFIVGPCLGYFFISGIELFVYLLIVCAIYGILIITMGFVIARNGVKLFNKI